MNIINVPDDFLSSEKNLKQTIESIKIADSEIPEYLYYASEEGIDKYADYLAQTYLEPMEEVYRSGKSGVKTDGSNKDSFESINKQYKIEESLKLHIKQQIDSFMVYGYKNNVIRPKANASNLLLVELANNLNMDKNQYILQSDIYDIDIENINSKLIKYFFTSIEDELRDEYRRLKSQVKSKQKILNRMLDNLRFKHEQKIKKLKKDIDSFEKKVKREQGELIHIKNVVAGIEYKRITKDILWDKLSLTKNIPKIKYWFQSETLPSQELYGKLMQETINKLDEMDDKEKEHLIKKLETNLKKSKKKLGDLKKSTDKQIEQLDKNLKRDLEAEEASYKKKYKGYFDKDLDAKETEMRNKVKENNIDKQEFEKKYKDFLKDQYLVLDPKNLPETRVVKAGSKTAKKQVEFINSDDEKHLKKKKRDLIDNCLSFLKAYNLIQKKEKQKDNNDQEHNQEDNNQKKENTGDNNYLKLNLKHWFEHQEHEINDVEILNVILPLLVSFIKFDNSHRVDNFLFHIDQLIDYTFQNPEKFSKTDPIEELLIKASAENKALDIYVNLVNGEDCHKNVTFEEIRVDDDNEKYIFFKEKDIDIYITDITKVNFSKDKTSTPPDSKSSFVSDLSVRSNFSVAESFKQHKNNFNIPDRKSYKAILEVDIRLLEFFDIKPLKNQTMYKTDAEIKQFCIDNNIDRVKNKIYVSAEDTTEQIIHVANRSIPHVKILKPDFIQKKFNDTIKSLCKELS